MGRSHSGSLLWGRDSGRIHPAWSGKVDYFWTHRGPRSCPGRRQFVKIPPNCMHQFGVPKAVRGLEGLPSSKLQFGFNRILEHDRFLHPGQTYLHERTRTVRIYPEQDCVARVLDSILYPSSQRCGEEARVFPQRHAHFRVLRLPTQVIEARGNFCSVHHDRSLQEKRAGSICASGEAHEQQNHKCLHNELEFHILLPVACLTPSPTYLISIASYISKSMPDSNWLATKLECAPIWLPSKLGGNTCWSLRLGPSAVYPEMITKFKLVTSLLDTRRTIFCDIDYDFCESSLNRKRENRCRSSRSSLVRFRPNCS